MGTHLCLWDYKRNFILWQREQLAEHEERAARLEEELAALRHARDNAPHARDKEHYLVYEVSTDRTIITQSICFSYANYSKTK